MTTSRPRTIILGAIALLVMVLGLFGFALLRANQSQRRDAEQRFRDRAAVSASLTEAVFSSSSGQAAADNARRYGSETVSTKVLDAQARRGQLAYIAVLDSTGKVIAGSSKLPADARSRLNARPPIVAAALRGDTFAISDVQSSPGGAPGQIEYATPFTTAYGKRVLVSGFGAGLLSGFIGGYLANIPDAGRSSAYVIDRKGHVVGTPVKSQAPGTLITEPGLAKALSARSTHGTYTSKGTERAYTQAKVNHTSWQVVLTTPASRLYADSNATVEWLILLALALAGMVAVYLLSRMAKAAAAVQDAKNRLELSNTDLARSNLELQRSNSELEQFASVASHDLQEPLRKVQTFGDQIERRFGDQMPSEAIDYLRRMRASANRMSTLIEDLLRFSRVTTHARPPSEVDLGEVAREVTSDLDAPLSETRGTVEIGRMPVVQADPLQMRQLLQNLIANGIKFHRPGISPEVKVESVPSGSREMVAFRVSDNGIGFEPQYAERIFRVFERLHPRDVFEGTGIGLALCRKIVERHGGTITAQGGDDATQGAAFIVTLPVVQARRYGGDATEPEAQREPVHA